MSAYNYTTAIYILLEYACTGLALLLMVIVLVKLALAGRRRRADSASPPQPDRRRGGSINYTLSVSDSQPQDSGIIGRSKLDMMTPHTRGARSRRSFSSFAGTRKTASPCWRSGRC